MLKKEIKYKDVDGNDQTEIAWFNLTKAECIELNIRNDLEVIGRSKNNGEIMDTFNRIIGLSYGLRTGDGKFIKEERDFKVFKAGEAYSELFMQIWQNPEYALEFIKGVLPAEVVAEMGDTPTQGNQSTVPAHMANHPSLQGHKAKAPSQPKPQGQPAPSEAELRQEAYPQPQVPTTPPSVPEQSDDFAAFQEWKRQQAAAQTPPASGVTTPEAPQQYPTSRDELI
jgi:hypothetical protein